MTESSTTLSGNKKGLGRYNTMEEFYENCKKILSLILWKKKLLLYLKPCVAGLSKALSNNVISR